MPKAGKAKRNTVRRIKQALLILGALAIIGAIVRAVLPGAVSVDTVVASRGPLEVEIREDGQTRVRDRYVVAAPLGGDLDRITVKPGTFVEAGTAIAHIRPPQPALLDERARSETQARLSTAQARSRQARSAVDRAHEAQHYAELEANRGRALYNGGAISAAERDRLQSAERIAADDVVAAEHQHAAASSEVTALRATLEPGATATQPFDVTAPVRGRILRVMRESAGPVAAGTALLEIGDPSSLEVVVDVLSQDAERISPGMPAEIDTAATQPARGFVTLVEPSAFTRVSALGVEEQRVNVIVRFAGPSSLGDAYRVDARIILWRGENVLRVPISSVFRAHGQWMIYVVHDGRAHAKTVEVGHRGRLEIEITKGLEPGERVIVHPDDELHEDVRVTIRASS